MGNEILSVIMQFAALAGVAALIAALVNIGKVVGIVKDGDAGKWSAGLNLGAMIALVAIRIFAPQYALADLDTAAAGIASALVIVIGYVGQMFVSEKTHDLLNTARIPLVGYSYWDDKILNDVLPQAADKSDEDTVPKE